MSERFSLKDHLFNKDSLGDLADEFAKGVPGFDPERFMSETLPAIQPLELMERLEKIADGVEAQLASDFAIMADQLEAAMPPQLDPDLRDDDFGRFIHAVPGILAVRHGLEWHLDRALEVLHAATRRFSMEFYIRAFLNRWPEETLERLRIWAADENYHVRRLVSEGTRPKLPWAKSIALDPLVPLEFLDRLHADNTRFVTRSVANHLNDISKIDPDAVLKYLTKWRSEARQHAKELAWIERHALRTLIKQGNEGAMTFLGYDPEIPVEAAITIQSPEIAKGAPLEFEVTLSAKQTLPVLVDYVLWFRNTDGKLAPKVFKLKQAKIAAGSDLTMKKIHKLKWDATTFRLFPGQHRLEIQVNGRVRAGADFTLLA